MLRLVHILSSLVDGLDSTIFWPTLVRTGKGETNMSMVVETADVSPQASIGSGTRIWDYVQVREGACIGQNCIIGKGTYIGVDVRIGNNVKIQNACHVFKGATLEDGVFLGPGVILANDKHPRAINPDGTLKAAVDWVVGSIHIGRGASVGAGAVILPDVTVGRFAMIGANSTVTSNVPDHGLMYGTPARLEGFVCFCGERLVETEGPRMVGSEIVLTCRCCRAEVVVPCSVYRQVEEAR